ncbi:hypothetical protein BG004_004002 [Podila humilis]|nr:hypothetical protein BG004_004002 [Podila humilis]
MDRNPYLSSLRLSHVETLAPHDEQDLRDFVNLLPHYATLQHVQIESRIQKDRYGDTSRSELDTFLVCEMIVKLMQFKDSVIIETDLRPILSNSVLNAQSEQRVKEEEIQAALIFRRIHELVESVDSYRVQHLSLAMTGYRDLDIFLAVLMGSHKKYRRLKRLYLENEHNTCHMLGPLFSEPFIHIQVLEINCASIRGKLEAVFRACTVLVSVKISNGGMAFNDQRALEECHGQTLESLVMKGSSGILLVQESSAGTQPSLTTIYSSKP